MKNTVNGHFLFRLLYSVPVFPKIDNAPVKASLIFWFFLFSHLELSHGRLPNIWSTSEHSDPIGMICMQAYRLLKKAARPCRRFLVAPTSISSWFLCPRPPLLLCTPNQNRHATQATFRWKANYVTCLETYKNTKTMHWSETWKIIIYLDF